MYTFYFPSHLCDEIHGYFTLRSLDGFSNAHCFEVLLVILLLKILMVLMVVMAFIDLLVFMPYMVVMVSCLLE